MKLEFVVIGMGTPVSFYLPGKFNHTYPLSQQIYSQFTIYSFTLKKIALLSMVCFISLSSKHQEAASATSRYI